MFIHSMLCIYRGLIIKIRIRILIILYYRLAEHKQVHDSCPILSNYIIEVSTTVFRRSVLATDTVVSWCLYSCVRAQAYGPTSIWRGGATRVLPEWIRWGGVVAHIFRDPYSVLWGEGGNSRIFSVDCSNTPVTPEARCHYGFWSKPPSP